MQELQMIADRDKAHKSHEDLVYEFSKMRK